MLETLLMIIADGYEVLSYYTMATLIDFCSMFCLPKSGRKQTLVNRIWEYVNSIVLKEKGVYITGNDVIPFIIKHDLHVGLSRSIIRKIASRPNDNASMMPCFNIMNSNFKAPIFEDICQEMFLYLMQCVNDQTVYIQNSHIRFCSPTFEENDAYIGCFKVVYNVLKSYSSNSNQASKTSGEYITIYDDDNNEKELSVNSHRYMTELSSICGLYDIECIESMKKFFMWTMEKYGKKRATGMVQIITGRFEGMKDQEISERYDIPKRSVERYSALLKVAYSEYSKECDDFKFMKPSYGVTFGGYMKNQVTNNAFVYGDIFESELTKYSENADIPKREYRPIPKSKTMVETFVNEYETKKALKGFYESTLNINSAFYGYTDNVTPYDDADITVNDIGTMFK